MAKEPPFYVVNELFSSIQGEGVLAGTPCTFIRLQGCTVGCSWCDSGPLADELEGKRATNGETRNTWGKGGTRMTLDEIMRGVFDKHVVITGGEPTLWNLDPLIRALRDRDSFIQLETSGQNPLKGDMVPDWITWSPKANLNFGTNHQIMMGAREVKWVVDDDLELYTLEDTYNEMLELGRKPPPPFVLMPEGCPPSSEHVQKCLSWLKMIPVWWRPNWRFGDRLQYRLGLR